MVFIVTGKIILPSQNVFIDSIKIHIHDLNTKIILFFIRWAKLNIIFCCCYGHFSVVAMVTTLSELAFWALNYGNIHRVCCKRICFQFINFLKDVNILAVIGVLNERLQLKQDFYSADQNEFDLRLTYSYLTWWKSMHLMCYTAT